MNVREKERETEAGRSVKMARRRGGGRKGETDAAEAIYVVKASGVAYIW